MHHHGATGNERQPIQNTANTGMNKMLNDWLDRGWVVVSLRLGTTGVDETPGVTTVDNNDGKWGNQPGRDGAAAVTPWLRSWCDPHARGILLYGCSMGGMFVLNHLLRAEQLGYKIAAACTVDGATNLRDNYDSYYGTQRKKDIRAAYALPTSTVAGDGNWVAAVDAADGGHDPQLVPMGDFPRVPVMLCASNGDVGVRKVYNTDLWVARALGDGWSASGDWHESATPRIQQVTYTGGHNADSHFIPGTQSVFFANALTL